MTAKSKNADPSWPPLSMYSSFSRFAGTTFKNCRRKN